MIGIKNSEGLDMTGFMEKHRRFFSEKDGISMERRVKVWNEFSRKVVVINPTYEDVVIEMLILDSLVFPVFRNQEDRYKLTWRYTTADLCREWHMLFTDPVHYVATLGLDKITSPQKFIDLLSYARHMEANWELLILDVLNKHAELMRSQHEANDTGRFSGESKKQLEHLETLVLTIRSTFYHWKGDGLGETKFIRKVGTYLKPHKTGINRQQDD